MTFENFVCGLTCTIHESVQQDLSRCSRLTSAIVHGAGHVMKGCTGGDVYRNQRMVPLCWLPMPARCLRGLARPV
eukprot:356152-Chlamydomonas_euryale.AAC.2